MPIADALQATATDRRVAVLRALAAGSSIAQAARTLGMSYRAAWQALDTLSALAGTPLAARSVGGAGGGGARPTAAGLALLAAHGALEQARRSALAGQAGAGAVRTSMRNQLPAVVERLAGRGAVRVCRLRLPSGAVLEAALTRESEAALGLARGSAVLLLCKATAVRVLAAGAGDGLGGTVQRVRRGSAAHEVTLALAPGVHLVGLAAPALGLRAGQAARAVVDPQAIVLALPA